MAITSQYYICNRCRLRTTLLSRINYHLLEHNSSIQPPRFPYFDCFNHLKPLKCPSCNFSTESLILLRYHLVRNHDQQQFALKAKLKTCKKCGFCTHSNYLWIRHPICGTCKGKKGSKEKKKKVRVSMKKHKKWHLCEKCDYRTVHLRNWKRHVINKHIPLEEIDWKHCNKCLAKFKTLNGLKKHQKYVHVSAVDHINCPECDYSTPSRSCLKTHFNNKHTQPEEIKWVECYHCGAKFKNKQSLKLHLVRHTTKKQFKCDQCPFETHDKKSLKSHIVNRHLKDEDIKWYKCQHCDYKGKEKRNVKRHIQYVHSKSVDLVQCPDCSFKTKWNSSLKNHIIRCHDDVAFKCDLCNYQAKCKPALKKHILLKHNRDGEVLDCKECDYKTRSKEYLTNHIRNMHKRPKLNCESCSFVTTTKCQLQSHMFNKHTDRTEEEKLNCSHCTYFCFNNGNLIQHLNRKHKIDYKIRWRECDKCNYKVQDKRSLASHMYKVHNDGKLLECDQCIYKTGYPRSMQRHKRNHKMKKTIQRIVSEKFECDICGFTTDQKRFIKVHITRSHLKTKMKKTDK